MYGGGELPQAFCRVAAVAGALYVLRQGIEKFMMDADTGLCRTLLTSSGQVIPCTAAVHDAIVAQEPLGQRHACHSAKVWEHHSASSHLPSRVQNGSVVACKSYGLQALCQ